jgi:uncharacterized protein
MALLVVGLVALIASLLTFFTGFGLGTLLLPAMLVFFGPELAVGLTAIVHLLNGLFKLTLVGSRADLRLAAKFGLPAMLAAFAGAQLLALLTRPTALYTYSWLGQTREITVIKLVIASLMLVFAALELSKRWQEIQIPVKYAPLGGLVTGFFGGLSGHQGALRSAFLVRAELQRDVFVATGVVISVAIDLSRLTVYVPKLGAISWREHGVILLVACLAAFSGAFAGNRLLKKVTLAALQRAVAFLLLGVAAGLAAGIL